MVRFSLRVVACRARPTKACFMKDGCREIQTQSGSCEVGGEKSNRKTYPHHRRDTQSTTTHAPIYPGVSRNSIAPAPARSQSLSHSSLHLSLSYPFQFIVMKSAKPTSKSIKAAGAAAVKKKKATKKEKKRLKQVFRAGTAWYFIKDFEHAHFEEKELEELFWLFIHADYGHEERVVRFLTDKGLDIDGLSWDFGTPLIYAIEGGKPRVVEALLKAGVKPHIPGHDVFFAAVDCKDGCMVKVLIKHGADVNIESDTDGTALHYTAVKAVALDDLTCLKLFLEAGAKERSVQGDTLVSEEKLTPTQYIQTCYGEDGWGECKHGVCKSDALERAVNLLASYRD